MVSSLRTYTKKCTFREIGFLSAFFCVLLRLNFFPCTNLPRRDLASNFLFLLQFSQNFHSTPFARVRFESRQTRTPYQSQGERFRSQATEPRVVKRGVSQSLSLLLNALSAPFR